MRAGKRVFWAGVLALSVLLLGLSLQHNAVRGRFARAFSTYGSGPEGTRALYLTLGELGFRTARWSQDLARLPPRATLIALGSCESAAARELSRYERDELTHWVERGGLLIVAGARNYLPRGLGSAFEDDLECELLSGHSVRPPQRQPADLRAPQAGQAARPADEVLEVLSELEEAQPGAAASSADEVWAVPMGRALKGLPLLVLHKPGRLLADAGLDFQTLLVAPQQVSAQSAELVPLALTYARGQGRVIVLSAANMLQNEALLEGEGAPLFARLLRFYAPRDLLIFDEYHLGLGERRSLMQYLRQAGMLPLLLQLLLVAASALLRAGARLGAVRDASAQISPLPAASFVATLGQLYARVGDRRAALRVIARGALARIARHYALGSLPAAALERELTRRGAATAAEAAAAIARVGSSAGDDALLAKLARIDAACEAALREPAGGSGTHSRGPAPDLS